MEWEGKIRRVISAAFEYKRGRQKRKPPEEVEIPEEGAEKLFFEITRLIMLPEEFKKGEEVLKMRHTIYQMGGRRMGMLMEKGICFVDELIPQAEFRMGVMSNGVHIQKYTIPERSIEPPDFSPDVTPVPEADINMGIAVARWLKRPYIELGKHQA